MLHSFWGQETCDDHNERHSVEGYVVRQFATCSTSRRSDVFDGLRKTLNERRQAKKRAEFERAAAESESTEPGDDRRARDLPDPLGDFNETVRMGPTIGGMGGGTSG